MLSDTDNKRPRARVLLAEDEERIRTVLVRILANAGHEPLAVGRGDEALLELVSGNYQFAILDAQMPGMGAIEIATQYHTTQGEHIPIIVITADASSDTNTKCMLAGILKVLTKPVRSQQLLDAIEEVSNGLDVSVTERVNELSFDQVIDERMLGEMAKFFPDSIILKNELRQCITRMKVIAEQIQKTMDDGQWSAMYRGLHGLEGVAVQMGARIVGRLCHELRRQQESEKQREIIQCINVAIEEVARLLESKYGVQVSRIP